MKRFMFLILPVLLSAQVPDGARYLIITHDNFYNDVKSLAEWKHKKGMQTKIAKLSETGSSSTQIRDYIVNAYNTWTVQPEYLLLVGAPNLLPWGQSSPYSDNPYMNMDGDIFNEILAGRLTVHNSDEAQTVINKILLYERTPYMTDSLWMRNACLIVREDSYAYPPNPGTDDYIYWGDSRHAYGLMLAHEYNRMDTLSRLLGHNTNSVYQSVNSGVGFVQFRGQGVGNWWSPFDVSPDATANGSMLPIVLSITCSTIGSGSTPATAERWLLTGTPTSPRGGAGYFATTTTRSGVAHIRSAVSRGFFTGIFTDRKRTFGEACEAGRLNLYNLYSDAYDYKGFATLGDPEMNIWTATPKQINVEHVPSLPTDADSVLVTVTINNNIPVESAQVCIVLDTTVYAYGFTDSNGQIVFQLGYLHPGQISVTVTGRNLYPHEGTMEIVGTSAYLQYQSHTISDSLGNNNGTPENGETILLTAMIRNIGVITATGVQAILTSNDTFVSIIDSLSYFGNIPPQDSAANISPYVIAISNMCPDNHIAGFTLVMEDAGNNEWTGVFSMVISNTSSGAYVGPDAYGYYMYDDTDTLTGYAPAFNWYGGAMDIVVEITNEDADTVTYPLPFVFPFYGISYNTVGLCSNGFLEMGASTYRFGDNGPIPSPAGPRRLIAPFWDDLDPRPEPTGTGNIYYAHDVANNRWILEFRSVGYYDVTSQRQTFQVQLLDPQYYTTPTGDGEILFLYDTVMNATGNTVGIEDHTQTVGLQYVYNNNYHPNAAPLANGRAILITTKVPVGIWLHTVNYSFDDSNTGNNNGMIEPGETIEVYVQINNGGNAGASNVIATLRTGSPDAAITDSTADLGSIPAGATAGNESDPFLVEISPTATDTTIGFVLHLSSNQGAYEKSDYFTLYLYGFPGVAEHKTAVTPAITLSAHPNPFTKLTNINFGIEHSAERIELRIFDATGRLVRHMDHTMLHAPCAMQVVWDGTDDRGRHLPNGVYFVNLEYAGKVEKTKVILVK
ncbi:hypothetical protein IBX73_00965 [candidate division WOR-3 bacterium]|nr:hypothetical protein [candidate division WOR-3 bacterium]